MEHIISPDAPITFASGGSNEQSHVAMEQKNRELVAEVASLQLKIDRFESIIGTDHGTEFEQKRTLFDLRESEQRFRLLVEGVEGYAIFMLDTAGRIASWNAGATRIKGYLADEILGRHFSCFYTPEDIAAGKPEKELEIATAQGRYEEEGLRVRKGGHTFWALVVITALRDDAGVLRGFAKVTRDISERKNVEEKTSLMVELAVNAMILVDARGLLVLANPQTEKLFGYSQTELLGSPVEMLVPESARLNHPALRSKFFASPSVRAMGAGRDLFGRRKDGTEFPVEIGLNPVSTGGELLVMGSIVDITERKRAEDNARQHLTELAHAGRLSTVGEMLSGLAHEINQPLAAAANYARACIRMAKSEGGATTEQLLEWIEKAAAQSERATEIVKRIGAFMKKDRSIRSELNINRLIERVIVLPMLLSSATDVGCQTISQLDLAEPLPMIFADKVQIEQVLVNLIRNAIEAMEGLKDDQRRLIVKTRHLTGMIEVSVSDNGHGIPHEQQVQLFNPFFTTKTEGMGLGLSISRSIIETHRGQMRVESDPGRGTTFFFQLPTETGEVTE